MKRHLKSATAKLCLIFCLISLGFVVCTQYDPNLWTGYDILNPNEEVRKNPLGFTDEGYAIVNQAFIFWTYELKEEIKRLRAELKKK